MNHEKGSIGEAILAAAIVHLWLSGGADIGLVQCIRSTRALEALLAKVKEAINNTQ